jgi:hypothetical protein
MEPEILIAIISSITAGISVIATYFFGVLNEKRNYNFRLLNEKRNFELEYDKKMIDERLDAYKKLWKLFLPLAKYSPHEDTTYSTLKNLSTSMSKWYYEESGGIFLAINSRKEYFATQDELTGALKNINNFSEKINTDLRDMLYDKASSLRTKLTEDLGSRANSLFVNDKIKDKNDGKDGNNMQKI